MLYALLLTVAIQGADPDDRRPSYRGGVGVSTEKLVGYSYEQCEETANKWRSVGILASGTPYYSARCLPMSPLEEALLMRQLQQTIPSDKVK